MSKVTINQEKLRVSENMQHSEEQGRLMYAKKETIKRAKSEREKTNDRDK